MATCAALIRCRRANITALGRALATTAHPKHAIKRVDRLIGNPRLLREQRYWYREIARRLIGSAQRVVLAIDWTEVGSGLSSLAVTTTGPGRGVTLYQETHSHVRGGERFFHDFLTKLADVLPDKCQAILVADAGFRKPFMQACHSLGFDYVLRVRAPATIGYRSERVRYYDVIRGAKSQPCCLGEDALYDSNCSGVHTRLVLGPKPRRRLVSGDGTYQRRAQEPWLLATTIPDLPASEIVRIYALRMHVEETFRDAKSPRLGLGASYYSTRSCLRANNLLLVVALAQLFIVLTGLAGEKRCLARRFQANTIRSRRVLSVFRLGLELLSGLRPRPPISASPRAVVATVPQPWTKFHRQYRAVPPHDLYCPDCGDHFAEYGWPSL